MAITGIHARLELSDLELRVAMLARSGAGRNAIAAALGLSSNSVKTLFTRIRKKLGTRWQTNPRVWWPNIEPSPEENVSSEDAGFRPKENQLPMAYKAHAVAFTELIMQSRPGHSVLKVSGAQRFWLKPALAALLERKYLRLLAVDWQNTFAPAWLPIVNRGRKTIRAATYATENPRYVQAFLRDYLQLDLPGFYQTVAAKLAEASRLAGRQALYREQGELETHLREVFPAVPGM